MRRKPECNNSGFFVSYSIFFIKKNNKKSETPQEIQKRYPEYSVLVEDLVLTNKRMIEYKDLMGKIAFNR